MKTTKNRPAAEKPQQSTFNRLLWFGTGLLYLWFTAFALSNMTRTPLWMVLLAVVLIAALLMSIIATLGVRFWRYRSQGWQFQLSTLFLVIVYLSIFLAALRWIIDSIPPRRMPPAGWVPLVIQSLFFIGMTSFMLLRLSESFIWLAVRIIRSSWIQRTFGR